MMKHGAILLVEDDPIEAELMCRALEKCRVDRAVVRMEDGQDALDYLSATGAFAGRDRSDVPSLVLLDLKLPRLSGLEVLKRIRATPETRRVPVVVMTSSAQEQDRAAVYDHGANSYVQKPVRFELFVDAMDKVRTYWLNLNQEPPRGGEPA